MILCIPLQAWLMQCWQICPPSLDYIWLSFQFSFISSLGHLDIYQWVYTVY